MKDQAEKASNLNLNKSSDAAAGKRTLPWKQRKRRQRRFEQLAINSSVHAIKSRSRNLHKQSLLREFNPKGEQRSANFFVPCMPKKKNPQLEKIEAYFVRLFFWLSNFILGRFQRKFCSCHTAHQNPKNVQPRKKFKNLATPNSATPGLAIKSWHPIILLKAYLNLILASYFFRSSRFMSQPFPS